MKDSERLAIESAAPREMERPDPVAPAPASMLGQVAARLGPGLLQRKLQRRAADKVDPPEEATAADQVWPSIVPDAVLKKDDKARKNDDGAQHAHGALTDYDNGKFSYHTAGKDKHETAEAAPLTGTVTQQRVDGVCSKIANARAA